MAAGDYDRRYKPQHFIGYSDSLLYYARAVMPELPEVEIARRIFNKILKGKKIVEVFCGVPKMLTPTPAEFRQKVIGRTVTVLERRAKLLIINLDDGRKIIFHFKLTGQLVYQNLKGDLIMAGHPMDTVRNVPNKFSHIIFTFSDASKLYFNDLRKFAYVKLLEKHDIIDGNGIAYGVEPLSEEFTLPRLSQLCQRRPNMKIKQFLLDQKFIAGIGNIYADEILHFAKIQPIRQVKSLKREEVNNIFLGTRQILRDSVAAGSTSYDSYAGEDRNSANFNKYLMVYQREGEPCLRKDGGIIKRIKLAGRSSHFCPVCQK